MKTRVALIIGITALAVVSYAEERPVTLPLARLVIKAVDENRAPVEGVNVSLSFMEPVSRQPAVVEGLTNAEGLFVGEGGSDSSVGSNIHKAGYYPAGFPFAPFREVREGKWQPWGATYMAVLRKIENPIPMYARRLRRLVIPIADQPCGFDLEASDWVAPWGKGKIADFVMTLTRRYASRDDFDVNVVLSFTNPLDGIQETNLPEQFRGSEFLWPRQAPERGFEPTHSSRFGAKPGSDYYGNASEESAFFFRVRTQERNGQIVGALYGKIKGGIRLEGRETGTCAVAFAYYLNPTSLDRNMEWDTKRNLLTGLSHDEKPRLP
jgi:hypothetical protein